MLSRWIIACLVAFNLPVGVLSADEASETKSLQGTWLPESAELAGKKFPDEIRKTIKLTIKDSNYTVMVGNLPDKGTTKIKPEASPKEMVITGTEGPNKGKAIPAIYEIDGDTLKVCYDLSCKAHPKEFKTKAGTRLYLVVYKREKK